MARMAMGQKAAARMIVTNLAEKPSHFNSPSGLRGAANTASGQEAEKPQWGTLSDMEASMEAKVQGLEEHMNDDKHPQTAIQVNFDLFMGGVIIVNILWIAIEMDFGPPDGTPLADRLGFWLVSSAFLVLFILEIEVRLFWERRRWIYGFWNWFDLVVVLCAIADIWVLPFLSGALGSLQSLTILRLARLIRLVRMVKLVRNMHSLYVMVMAFLHALQSMGFLGCIMFFGMLIYAIFATMLIGQNSEFDGVMIMDDTVDDRFGKVYRSMYSLFELMTLEGWEQVARPLVEAQPLVFLFIGSFIMIFTYGMLNMIVATVVEKTMEQSHAMKEYDQMLEMRKVNEELHGMKKMFADGDVDKSGSLTEQEFSAALLTNETLRSSLEKLGVPAGDAKDLFMTLDFDSNGELSIAELVQGVEKLKSGKLSVWDELQIDSCVKTTKIEVLQLREQLSNMASQQSAWQQSVDNRLDEQGLLLRGQWKVMQEVLACVRKLPNVNRNIYDGCIAPIKPVGRPLPPPPSQPPHAMDSELNGVPQS